jgi:hypothetical protein
LLLPISLLAGCGSGGMGTVTGTVMADGKPLANATVEFYPEEGGRSSSARTDENGNYELRFGRDEMGALVGQHKVSIQTGGAQQEGDYGKITRETLPAKYNVSTELLETVSAGANVINFDLDYEGEVIQPDGAEGGRY